MRYKYACLVQLEQDDPANNMDKGDLQLVAGKNEGGYSYTVMDHDCGDFVDIECSVVNREQAPERMGESEIIEWASNQEQMLSAAEVASQ